MNIPINCPICNDPLLNKYDELSKIFSSRKTSSFLEKSCSKRINHSYVLSLNQDAELFILEISFILGNFCWNFERKISYFWGGSGEKKIYFPWFEPEIIDAKKFMNKLRAIVVFS